MGDPRTQATQMQREAASSRPTGEQSGWVYFAAIILFMIGCFNILWGLGALFQDEVLTRSASGDLIVWDTTTWGWIQLIFGVLILLTGLGLFGNQGWARWTAVVLVGVNALAQLTWLTWYPLWAILIITLDIVVIYQLTARWNKVEEGY